MNTTRVEEGGIEFDCDWSIQDFIGTPTLCLHKVYIKGVDITEVIDYDWLCDLRCKLTDKYNFDQVADQHATDLDNNEAYGI